MKFLIRMVAVLCAGMVVACGQPPESPTTAPQSIAAPAPTRPPDAPENTPLGGFQSHGGPVVDHGGFVDFLRGQGWTVTIDAPFEQPFLRGLGTTLQINGGTLQQPVLVQSFNYDDADVGGDGATIAAEDMSTIQPNGNPEGMQIAWIEPPHWFYRERIIVLYVGSDPDALSLLTTALGPQVAGR